MTQHILLHSPVLSFHIGAWAVTALCTFLAFWINFLRKRHIISDRVNNYLGNDVVVKLDFVAHVTGIIGLGGIVLAIWTGFIDASGQVSSIFSIFDLNLLIKGINIALGDPLLSFKIQWTFVGIQLFVFAGIIRYYFVTYKKGRTVYDEHFTIQVIYSELTLVAYTIVTIVGAVGGLYATGHTIVADIPIIKEFLPGGNLLLIFAFFSAFFAGIIVIGTLIKEQSAN